ncbi:MAG: sigma-70 family RNA polymerase sigma factor [Proteobacteria bacterium]|nr:sigma-70 family RNA polymerase sigma factor [Pseudomonadota bacterium]
MSESTAGDSLTEQLRAAHGGDRAAAERAYRMLYPELCKIARAHLRAHRRDTLLDTRVLVLEGYLNLAKVDGALFENRRHFYAYAAKVMRRIVIDFARRRQSQRHGGGAMEQLLTTSVEAMETDIGSVLDVERLLAELEGIEPLAADIVEMRYFGGYSDAEIAEALGVTDRTVRRHWEKARLFMLAQLRSAG